jgi:high affinity Mn2+ porin
MKRLLASLALAATSFGTATAADFPLKAPAAVIYDWTGFYVGGHIGYGGGSFGPRTFPSPLQGVFFPSSVTGMIGGYQFGYQYQLRNRIVLGFESDISFSSPIDTPRLQPAPFNTTIDYIATARGRIGYAFGAWQPYATGGLAWGQTHIDLNNPPANVKASHSQAALGWTAGAGVAVGLGGNWSANVEYNYIDLAHRTYDLGDIALPPVQADPAIQIVKLGLNYHLNDPLHAIAAGSFMKQPALFDARDWSIHGQSTFLQSAYPSIRSPYEGVDSLPRGGQTRETWTTTAFLGWRLWNGGEFYFNPELGQGFGLNGTLGLAGFSNGEAQKAGVEFPKFRPQRYYFKQTFGFGGEQEDIPDGPNQVAGKRDIDRLTVIVGRFAVGDFFDGNAYAKDPRADFMNWAMWSSAAYDFPADLPGFTRGGVVEVNRKDWALRAGFFQVPAAPNSDVLTFQTGGTVVELEERYAIVGQPGKLRLGAFANSGNTGNYRDALALSAATPAIDINTALVGNRRDNLKYGFYANAEQQLATDIGAFARISWNDGQTEILSFTDIDSSASGGLSVKGSFWGRANDTVGLGGAINGLSAAHRDFLAAGGTGLLIGDGRLNYRTEQILESYYAYALNKAFTFTADYQFIANPAYNADRGPVSVFSGRLHGEF